MKTMRELLNWGEKFALENRKEDSAVKLLLMDATQKESYEICPDGSLPGKKVRRIRWWSVAVGYHSGFWG